MHRGAVAVLAAAVLGVSGCGSPGQSPVGDGGDGEPRAQAGNAKSVDCGGSQYDPSRLADAPGVSSLPDEVVAGAVDDAGEPAFDPSQDWRVVHQSDSRVDLVRELKEPVDLGEGDVRTHESRTLDRITDAPTVPEGTWLLVSAGPCTQRLIGDDDLGEADLTLPAEPSPEATNLDLLVHERACASGQAAEGRIHLVELDETSEQVRLRIAVRPYETASGVTGVTCQGNPPTPFTIELAQPVGDREVVDASVVPARRVTVESDGSSNGGRGNG